MKFTLNSLIKKNTNSNTQRHQNTSLLISYTVIKQTKYIYDVRNLSTKVGFCMFFSLEMNVFFHGNPTLEEKRLFACNFTKTNSTWQNAF